MLDAVLSPDWEYRYYSFNSKWAPDEMMASMRNGSGDEYFILFNSAGAIIKGFDHESPMSPYASESQATWPGVLDEVPTEFHGFLAEPAFSIQDTTFCVWRRHGDATWQTGKMTYPHATDPDGSEGLLFILDGNPTTYQAFAEDYYGQNIELAAVAHIYEHKALTPEILIGLNADVTIEELEDEVAGIGYPKGAT